MFDKGSPVFDWVVVENMVITRGFPGTIPDVVWNAFLQVMEENKVSYILTYTFGTAALSATQRRAAADLMRKLDITAVVVTDSALTRGIVTAVSWLGAKTKSFSWEQVEAAVKYFGVSAVVEDRAREIALEFREYASRQGKGD